MSTLEPTGGLQFAVGGHARCAAGGPAARGHRRVGARGRHCGGGQGLLCRARPERDARRAIAGLLRAAVRAVRAFDADDPAAAAAGDRARARHRHRRRLPAGGHVRPGGGRQGSQIRRQRRQPGPVLRHAQCRFEPQPGAQGGLRDAGHGRLHQRRAGAREGLGEPRRRRRPAGRRGRGPGHAHRRQAARRAGSRQGLVLPPARRGHRVRV